MCYHCYFYKVVYLLQIKVNDDICYHPPWSLQFKIQSANESRYKYNTKQGQLNNPVVLILTWKYQ